MCALAELTLFWSLALASQDIYDQSLTSLNTYSGGQFQMSASGLTTTCVYRDYRDRSAASADATLTVSFYSNQNCYELAVGGAEHTGCFAVFAFEYQPGMDGASSICRLSFVILSLNSSCWRSLSPPLGYITCVQLALSFCVQRLTLPPASNSWFSNDKPSWTYRGQGMHAQSVIDVGDRPIPGEPLCDLPPLSWSLDCNLLTPAVARPQLHHYEPRHLALFHDDRLRESPA